MSVDLAHTPGGELSPRLDGLRRIAPFPANNPRAREITILITLVAVFLLGFNHDIARGLTTGTIVVLVLLPVWASTVREFRFAPFLMITSGAALAWGAILHDFNPDHQFSMTLATEVAVLFFTGMGGVGLLLWARTVMPTYVVVMTFGIAYLLGVAHNIPGSDNAWKYQISVPFTMILLAWASKSHSIGPTIFALGFIGLVSAALDSRSYFGFCLLSIVLVLWQRRKNANSKRMSKLATVSLIIVALTGLYFVSSALLVQGYLGEEAQARTIAQLQENGSLLVSGRPEWAGTVELMLHNPAGFGLGTLPTSDDVWNAKTGMVKLGLDVDPGYVENYMFGGHIKLHSMLADFWVSFGLVGFALGLAVIGIFIYCLLEHLSQRTATGLVCMMAIVGIWDMGFGPIHTNMPDVMLALAVVLPTVAVARNRPSHPLPAAEPEPDAITHA